MKPTPSPSQLLAGCALLMLHSAEAWAERDAPPWQGMPEARLPERLPIGAQAQWSVKALAAQFEASDAVPVRALSGDWRHYGPRDGRNVALQSARLDLSASKGPWEVGTALRSDILISGERGAFDVVHAYKQKLAPVSGSSFELNSAAQGVIWTGLRGARTWVLVPGADHGVQFTAAVALLSVRRVQLTSVDGTAGYKSAAGFNFNAQTVRQDSHVEFSGYGKPRTTGNGYTTDLGLLWQPTARSFVNVSVSDAFSKLTVRSVATEEINASSTTRLFDASGYLDYRPLLNGRNSSQYLTLKLVRKWSLSAGVQLDESESKSTTAPTVGARWEHIGGIDIPSVWASTPLPVWPQAGLALQVDADTRFKSVGVGLSGRFDSAIGSLMLRSQSASVGASRAVGWQAAVNLPW